MKAVYILFIAIENATNENTNGATKAMQNIGTKSCVCCGFARQALIIYASFAFNLHSK